MLDTRYRSLRYQSLATLLVGTLFSTKAFPSPGQYTNRLPLVTFIRSPVGLVTSPS
jgi:hypothetical protein